MRIGCVKYLNARPLIAGWAGPVVLDHPAALCSQLAAGELDAALVSSIEFLRNPIYRVVDGVSIASDGPVYSVIVVHRHDASVWSEVELDPASETSVALLRHLLSISDKRSGIVPMTDDALSPLLPNRARLLIGDQAIQFRQHFGDSYGYWDLGEAWKALTKLPFVYALWLVRPEVEQTAQLAKQLRGTRDSNLANLEQLVEQQRGIDREFCRRYYTEHLSFSLGDREKLGLREFANACANLGLTPSGDVALRLV
ncbi:MAG: menaquinone biosynthetic enzyme MqnA/MqnD family protein [Chthoniobacterales bacterium]